MYLHHAHVKTPNKYSYRDQKVKHCLEQVSRCPVIAVNNDVISGNLINFLPQGSALPVVSKGSERDTGEEHTLNTKEPYPKTLVSSAFSSISQTP